MSALKKMDDAKSPTTTPKTIQGMLADQRFKDQMAAALPKHLTPERMARIAMTEIRGNDKLQKSDPISLFGAIMKASALGLEVGGSGLCYLIPFKQQVNLLIGYKGLIQLALNSGKVASVTAHCVYENDDFDFQLGLHEDLVHRPNLVDPGPMIAVYAVAKMVDGTHVFEVMSKSSVDKIRNASQGKNSDPWKLHYDEMARKTAVRRLCKYLPLSAEAHDAVVTDEKADAGTQNNADWFEEARDITPARSSQEQPVTRGKPKKVAPPTAKTYAEVADELNKAPTKQQGDQILASMKGQLPPEQMSELAYNHVQKWDNTGEQQ